MTTLPPDLEAIYNPEDSTEPCPDCGKVDQVEWVRMCACGRSLEVRADWDGEPEWA